MPALPGARDPELMRALLLLLCWALLPTAAPAVRGQPLGPPTTVQQRFERTLNAMAGNDPVEVVLALWHGHELASLVPGGVERLGEVVGKLTRSRLPFVAGEAKLVAGALSVAARRADVAPFRAAGVPARGLVMGPLPGPSGPIGPETSVVGKHGPTGWRPFEVGAMATIPLEDYMPSSGDAHVRVGFAWTVDKPTKVRFVLGTNGPFVALLDGKPLAEFAGERAASDWQHDVPVTLAPGRHWLEVSVGHRTVAPTLSVRLLIDGVVPEALAVEAPPQTSGWTAWKAPPGLVARARGAQAAKLAVWVTPQLPSERHAAGLLEAAIADAAGPERAELYYWLGRAETTDVSRSQAAYEMADRLAGGHTQALSALLDLAERHQLPAQAEALARRLAAVDAAHPAVLAHRMLRRFELADGAAALPKALPVQQNARLLSLLGTIAESAGDVLRAAEAYRELAAIQLGAAEPVQRATRLYLRANAPAEAIATVDEALACHPMAADLHILKARALASNATPEALAKVILDLGRLRAFHHQSPHFEELRGRLLLLANERGKAIEAFDRALELAPQNRELADYRSTLVSERGLAERWAEPVEALLETARNTPRGDSAVYLIERTVSEVFPSGLASQFRQTAIRIDQRAVAQRFEDMMFGFTPGEDRLEILEAEVLRPQPDGSIQRIRPQQIGEQQQQGKADGVYTLTAYKVVRFAPLAVGDVVHIQMRKDEIGTRNLFGDFFGVFFPMSSEYPKVLAEAIVVAPTSRKLQYKASRLPEPIVTGDADMQQLRFVVHDLPGLAREPGMPGYGEIAAWISVSTFPSWEALASWYRQLVRPQLEVPADLARTARELVAGLTTMEAKVAAIQRWVVTKTRYVGIEFGIHGFKPYKVAEVVQRGYGDCKDKASLLVAMLRAVDVPAEFVLVRTRDLGAIEGTPATLWAFNHAIAYVPGLDLYIDGTAESSGLRELPELDQDAMVMRIDLMSDAPPVITRIPIQPGPENLVVAKSRYVIDADGDAVAELSEVVRGVSAGRLRARLQDPTRRDAIIAEIIAGQLPGTALDSARYENLDVLGAPVGIFANVRMPKLATRRGDALELPLVVEPGARLRDMAPLAVRKQPLVLTQTELEENTDRYVLPKGARLAVVPEPVRVTSKFGSWSLEVKVDGVDVVATSRWEIVQTRISPEEYPAFRRFLEDVTKAEAGRLRFELL